MSSYRRAKREDALSSPRQCLSIRVGSIGDSIEALYAMCNDKSVELIKSVELDNREDMQVVFWTEDIPELICVSRIIKSEAGFMAYSLDDSLSTLK